MLLLCHALQVYYQGKKAMDYNVDFFFFDSAQVSGGQGRQYMLGTVICSVAKN
jgi:hypothetical protein